MMEFCEKSAFSTYSFDKTRFFVFLRLRFLLFIFFVLCFEFNVILKNLLTFFNFILTLFKRSVKIESRYKNMPPKRLVYKEECHL